MRTAELVVIGAGPAGLAASVHAARAGVKVVLIDESANLGGNYLKQDLSKDKSVFQPLAAYKTHQLAREVRELPVEISLDTMLWSIQDNLLDLSKPET